MTGFSRLAFMVISGVALAGGITGCSHGYYGDTRGYAEIDIVDGDGYRHHGYYDQNRSWHGGWYDHDRRFHDDPHDWRRH